MAPSSNAGTVRVVIGDASPLLLRAISDTLSSRPPLDVVGAAQKPSQLRRLISDHSPHVAVVGGRLVGQDGPTTVAGLTELPTLAYTTYSEDGLVRRFVDAGAAGVVLDEAGPDELIAGVLAVAAGRRFLDRHAGDRLVAELQTRAVPGRRGELSSREREVLELASQGLTNIEIGAKLGISDQTVKTHLTRTYRKLDVSDRAAAVAVALTRGLL